jgi:hypothetical protein
MGRVWSQSLHDGNIMGFAVCSALNVKLGWLAFVGELNNIAVTGTDREHSSNWYRP